MKRLLLILLTCCACNRSEPSKSPEKPVTTVVKTAPWITLLAKFKEIDPNGLHIPSASGDDKGSFAGKAVDSLEAALFPREISSQYNEEYPGIYACYKFAIDERRVGLLARTPGEYSFTQITFFVFDLKNHRLTQGPMLAENWGDAGDWFSVESKLQKDKGSLQALVHTETGTDNSVEDENDTTLRKWGHTTCCGCRLLIR